MSERQYGIVPANTRQQQRAAEEYIEYPPRPDSHALRGIDTLYNPRIASPSPESYQSAHHHDPSPPAQTHYMSPPSPPNPVHQYSQSSLAPLTANRAPTPSHSPHRSQSNIPMMAAGPGGGMGADQDRYGNHRASYYHGDGYDNFDPSQIADDGDDGFEEPPRQRNSRLAMAAAAGFGSGAAAGSSPGFNHRGARDASGNYGPVYQDPEKSAMLSKKAGMTKRKKWVIGFTVAAILVVGGIVGGVVGGILANRASNGGGGGGGSGGTHSGGIYDINSVEVRQLLGDDRLHKVFPTVDYTPYYAQYPACLSPGGGPDQNNVTLDVTRLSQITPAIRLYGNDCNQTELVLEAITRLNMQDTIKVWLGVYLDGNQTTNDRQLSHMYDILDQYDHSSFVGIIVGNEVLFAETMTSAQLTVELESIRSNLTSKGINLPVSTADLGDNWDATLAQASDIVMANIHPFFAGTVAGDAAGWAYSFWHNKDIPLTAAATGTIGDITYPKQIISEIGWPSQGGNDCGVASDTATYGCTSDTDGAVASIDNLNTFMAGWVCDALTNGTTFFWFEAFDEPWKHQFDTAHNKWEPYWGLWDENRNLKDGIKIPDCGGTTVDKAY